MIKMCKRGHDYEVGKKCIECKRLRDRNHAKSKAILRSQLSEAELEAQRKYDRERYAEKMKNPEWAKQRSKKTSARYSLLLKVSPKHQEKEKQKRAAEWAAIKADPEKHARERQKGNKRSLAYYHRQFARPSSPEATAKRLLERAQRMAEEAKDGIIRVGSK